MHEISWQIPQPGGRQARETEIEPWEVGSLKARDELKLRRPSLGRVGRGGSITTARLSKAREAEHRYVHPAHELGPACCSLSI